MTVQPVAAKSPTTNSQRLANLRDLKELKKTMVGDVQRLQDEDRNGEAQMFRGRLLWNLPGKKALHTTKGAVFGVVKCCEKDIGHEST